MLNQRWVQWLLVLIVLAGLAGTFTGVFHARGQVTLAAWIAAASHVVVFAWIYWGLWQWGARRWVRELAAVVISGHVVVGLWFVLVYAQRPGMAIALLGVWAMAASFVLGLKFIRLLLTPGRPVTGVARTLVDEAVRMKIVLIFIVMLVLLVPLLPSIQSEPLLKYRMQTFLSYALAGVSVLLSLMTIFVACGTITYEISQKQIYMTMVKPISRAEYLLGKWLGIVLLNALLLTISGVGIYAFAKVLQQQPARDVLDRIAVDEQVLVARESVTPVFPEQFNYQSLFDERARRLRLEDPDRYGDQLTPMQEQDIRQRIITQWHTIPTRTSQAYHFKSLQHAAALGPVVQLRFKPQAASITPGRVVHLGLRLNDRQYELPALAEGIYHVIDLPVEAIDSSGVLRLEITNLQQQTISFTPIEGLQILYRVGSFEPNLMRALTILWIRLSFLAALGLAVGAFTGFPVASLICMTVYVIALASGFLSESLQGYVVLPSDGPWFDRIMFIPREIIHQLQQGEIWGAIKVFVRLLGTSAVLLIPSFSQFNPVPLITDGRLVSNRLVLDTLLWVGAVWTLTCAVVGWLIFRKRELARVMVS